MSIRFPRFLAAALLVAAILPLPARADTASAPPVSAGSVGGDVSARLMELTLEIDALADYAARWHEHEAGVLAVEQSLARRVSRLAGAEELATMPGKLAILAERRKLGLRVEPVEASASPSMTIAHMRCAVRGKYPAAVEFVRDVESLYPGLRIQQLEIIPESSGGAVLARFSAYVALSGSAPAGTTNAVDLPHPERLGAQLVEVRDGLAALADETERGALQQQAEALDRRYESLRDRLDTLHALRLRQNAAEMQALTLDMLGEPLSVASVLKAIGSPLAGQATIRGIEFTAALGDRGPLGKAIIRGAAPSAEACARVSAALRQQPMLDEVAIWTAPAEKDGRVPFDAQVVVSRPDAAASR